MKHLFIFLLFSLFYGQLVAQQEFAYPLPFKAGTTSFVYRHGDMQYSARVYVSDYGNRQTINISRNMTNEGNGLRLVIKRGFLYKLDLVHKTVTRKPYIAGLSLRVLKDSLNHTGDEVLLNRRCSIYESNSLRAWFWGNYLMKLEDMSKNEHYRVTTINENTNLPANIFDVPSDYKKKEINFNFEYLGY